VKFARCSEKPSTSTGYKVAVLGAGPAGLTVAGELACKGYEVHVFDRLPEPGGMLMFVIPSFRFRKDVVRKSIGELERLDVEFHTGTEIGSRQPVFDYLKKYDATVVATGTWESARMGVKGEELPGVYYALEWLYSHVAYELGYGPPPPKPGTRVVVVGGGLSAVDACELAARAYGVKPIVVYRRPLHVAPAARELTALKQRGLIEVIDSSLPVEIVGAKGVEGLKVASVKPTSARGEALEVVQGSERVIEADTVIVAAGLRPTPPPSLTEMGVKVAPDGRVLTDDNMMSSVAGLFAAGDVAHGASNIYKAMESGRKAALGVDSYLRRAR
jgi:glutamate synthase (NADPH/NADH) small chain